MCPQNTSTKQSAEELVGRLTFTITAHGIFARIPLVERAEYTVALLGLSRRGDRLGLLLSKCPLSADREHPLYDIGTTRMPIGIYYRLVSIQQSASGDVELFGQTVRPQWRQVYLANRPPKEAVLIAPPRVLISFGLRAPFRFLQRHLQEIYNRYNLLVESAEPESLPWTGASPVRIAFTFDHDNDDRRHRLRNKVMLHLGRCTSSGYSLESSQRQAKGLGPHWANVQFGTDFETAVLIGCRNQSPWDYEAEPSFVPEPPQHACPADHICEWQNSTKTFIDGTYVGSGIPGRTLDRAITLSFTPCPINPSNTLIVNMSGSWPADLTDSSVVWSPPIRHTTPPDGDSGSCDADWVPPPKYVLVL